MPFWTTLSRDICMKTLKSILQVCQYCLFTNNTDRGALSFLWCMKLLNFWQIVPAQRANYRDIFMACC